MSTARQNLFMLWVGGFLLGSAVSIRAYGGGFGTLLLICAAGAVLSTFAITALFKEIL